MSDFFNKIAFVVFLLFGNISLHSSSIYSSNSDFIRKNPEHSEKKNKIDFFDSINRFIFHFNEMINHAFINPITVAYDKATPFVVKNMVSNFLKNLMMPFYAVCSVLSGDYKEGAKSVGSFFMNTVFGGGFFAVNKFSPKYQSLEDVFAKHGISRGEYIVLPVFGPSSIRDVLGKLIGCFINPFYIFTQNLSYRDRLWIYHTCAVGIDTNCALYKNLNVLKNSSNNYYDVLRSVYLQKTQKNNSLEVVDEYSDQF